MNNEQDEEMMAKSEATNGKHGFQRCAACGVYRPKDKLKKNETTFPNRRADALVCVELEFCRPIADEREAARLAKAAKLDAAKDYVAERIMNMLKHEAERARADDYEHSIEAVDKLFTIAIKSVRGAR